MGFFTGWFKRNDKELFEIKRERHGFDDVARWILARQKIFCTRFSNELSASPPGARCSPPVLRLKELVEVSARAYTTQLALIALFGCRANSWDNDVLPFCRHLHEHVQAAAQREPLEQLVTLKIRPIWAAGCLLDFEPVIFEGLQVLRTVVINDFESLQLKVPDAAGFVSVLCDGRPKNPIELAFLVSFWWAFRNLCPGDRDPNLRYFPVTERAWGTWGRELKSFLLEFDNLFGTAKLG